ncbi:nuclear transport factor 2 family protein [Streptomyces sp. NPDC060243]|uniref:nuclear transport factor 2 family protein n=1 Tax=Streptomyces sp. NPDC060243 TaxID=3347081 RepID=UPI00365C978D
MRAGFGSEVEDCLRELLARRACERSVLDLVHRLDLGRPASVAELCTPDGVWEWAAGGRRVAGREESAAYFGGRPADRLSRRPATNIRVPVDSPDTAHATSCFVTYRVDGHDPGRLVPPPPPADAGHCEDSFHRVEGAWFLAHRRLHPAFGGPTPRHGA